MALLEGHSVLIVGGGSGLGLGVARACLSNGATLSVLEIAADKIAALPDILGKDTLVIQGNATRIQDVEQCRQRIFTERGRLDAVICFQGVYDGNTKLADVPSDKIDALFDELFHINVKSQIIVTRVFSDMLKASKGALVLTSSSAAYAADGGGAFYTATKGAIVSLVRQLAFELAPDVRVNGVAPAAIARSQLRGPAALRMDGQKQSDIPADLFRAKVQSISLLQEVPAPEDYAVPYMFLASKQNRVMTGQTIVAEQGLLNRTLLS